ncbi:hypothetical protein ACFL6K_05880 [Candidatus Latescibacterota bacterium]
MRKFWRLYRKELRFLLGPAVVMILLLLTISLFSSLLQHEFEGFYNDNISHTPQDPSFVSRFIIRPFLSIGDAKSLGYIYAVLFLYILFYEHYNRTKYQLYSLPVKRWFHLAAKYSAMCTWIVAVLISMILSLKLRKMIFIDDYPLFGNTQLGIVAHTIGSLITYPVFLCSLATIGYVVAVSIKRIPFIVGPLAVLIVSYFYKPLPGAVYKIFARYFPPHREIYSYDELRHFKPLAELQQVTLWVRILFPAVFAIMLFMVTLFIYEKYTEV